MTLKKVNKIVKFKKFSSILSITYNSFTFFRQSGQGLESESLSGANSRKLLSIIIIEENICSPAKKI